MGYTHYWELKEEVLDKLSGLMPAIASDFKKILGHLPPLAGPSGKGNPLLGPEEIWFNGRTPDDYEDFHFPGNLEVQEKGWTFDFVKTERRPYDLAVVGTLAIAKFHLGEDIRVLSDGSLQDVAPGVNLVERILGYPMDPFYLLGREVIPIRDGKGRIFFAETRPGEDRKEVLDWLGYLLEYLRIYRPGEKFPYTPPFHVVEGGPTPLIYRLKPVLPGFGVYREVGGAK